MTYVVQENYEIAKEQIRKWWTSGGSVLFIALPVCLFVACWQFLMGVTLFFESRFDHMGEKPFDYGCMKSWLTLPIATCVAFLCLHVSFLGLGSCQNSERAALSESQPEHGRLYWCCKHVPVVGLAFTDAPPSWDDLEKTLQIYALMTGLVLSMVGGVIFEDVGDLDKATDIYGALYGSLELLFLAVMVVACLYLYLMVYVDQESLQEEVDQEKTKIAQDQIDRWWQSGGNLLFIALPICLFVACWQFIMGVTLFFESRFRDMGGEPFDYGCMKTWLTLPILAGVMFVFIHASFLIAGWAPPPSCGDDTTGENPSAPPPGEPKEDAGQALLAGSVRKS
jgi:hypothetical protein